MFNWKLGAPPEDAGKKMAPASSSVDLCLFYSQLMLLLLKSVEGEEGDDELVSSRRVNEKQEELMLVVQGRRKGRPRRK